VDLLPVSGKKVLHFLVQIATFLASSSELGFDMLTFLSSMVMHGLEDGLSQAGRYHHKFLYSIRDMVD